MDEDGDVENLSVFYCLIILSSYKGKGRVERLWESKLFILDLLFSWFVIKYSNIKFLIIEQTSCWQPR